MLALFFLIFVLGCYFSLAKDGGMLQFLILVGFLQDPARKLIESEPVYMTIMVGLIAGCAFLRILMTNSGQIKESFLKWNHSLANPLILYFIILCFQFIHALIRYGIPIVPALGLIFYLAPLVAITIGYAQFPNFTSVRRFLTMYVVIAFIISLTVLLSFFGVESPLFEEVGSGLKIYDQGTILKAHSGLMRSSEVAGWHMGASACFLLILTVDKRVPGSVAVAGFVILLTLAAIILTGRRKMIFQFFMFAILYFPFLRLYQARFASGYIAVASMIAAATYVGALMLFPITNNSDFELYLMRGSSVFGDAGERFNNLGLGSMGWAIDRYGLLGGGLGVAAQGAQHFTSTMAGGIGEGGLGKIVSELGAISLLVVVWLLYAIATHINRCLVLVSKNLPERLPFAVGVAVFVVSNVPTFIVASQVFGDVFVLLIIGLLIGFLFAVPKLVIFDMIEKGQQQGVRVV